MKSKYNDFPIVRYLSQFFRRTGFIIILLIFVTSGTFQTLLVKIQNEHYVVDSTNTLPPHPFSFPWCQSWLMFLGMTNNLYYFWISQANVFRSKEKKSMNKKKKNLPKVNELWFIVPAILDLIAMVLEFYGLLLTYASVAQMLRSFVVVFTSILSVLFLKKDIWKMPHKWAGVISMVLGSFLVGLSSVIFHEDSKDAPNPLLGAIFVIIGEFFYGFMFVFEELVLHRFDTNSSQVCGYEGLWGIFCMNVLMLVLYFVPGSGNYNATSFESFAAFISTCVDNPNIMLLVLSSFINVGVFSLLGIVLTKKLSAAAKTTLDSLRHVSVWVIQLLRRREQFEWLQLIGFVCIVGGLYVFNEVGMNVICPKYLKLFKKKKLPQREDEGHEIEDLDLKIAKEWEIIPVGMFAKEEGSYQSMENE